MADPSVVLLRTRATLREAAKLSIPFGMASGLRHSASTLSRYLKLSPEKMHIALVSHEGKRDIASAQAQLLAVFATYGQEISTDFRNELRSVIQLLGDLAMLPKKELVDTSAKSSHTGGQAAAVTAETGTHEEVLTLLSRVRAFIKDLKIAASDPLLSMVRLCTDIEQACNSNTLVSVDGFSLLTRATGMWDYEVFPKLVSRKQRSKAVTIGNELRLSTLQVALQLVSHALHGTVDKSVGAMALDYARNLAAGSKAVLADPLAPYQDELGHVYLRIEKNELANRIGHHEEIAQDKALSGVYEVYANPESGLDVPGMDDIGK